MDLVYGIPLIALLAVVWAVVRHVANKARRRRDALREQKRRSRAMGTKEPDSTSERSDMRRTDAPVTVIDSIQKRAPPPPESTKPGNRRTER
jgi:hypothetical protein